MLQTRRTLISCFDGMLDLLQDVSSSIGWAEKMNGAMVPVTAAEHVKMTVKSGKVPEDLQGVYMRVGPNAQFWPPKKRTHAFDGDGMVHTVRISSGEASYNCRFMETPRYIFEKEMGSEWFTRVGEMTGLAGLLKILTVGKKKLALSGLEANETGTANTAIGYTPDGKLWALNESSAPFQFRLDKDGVPESIGFDYLQGTLKESISAHPKFDQRNGDILYHGRKLAENTFYAGKIVDGKLVERVDIDMPVAGFHHDMFITENYMVMIDGAMSFTPQEAIKGKQLWSFDQSKKLRFGIFPRSQKLTQDQLQWIEADVAAEIVHTCYAYDADGKIILWTPVSYYDADSNGTILGNMGTGHMHRVVIDLQNKNVKIQEVEGGQRFCTEFPRIRDDRTGLRVRYGYSGLQSPLGDFDFRGILKWDFDHCKLDKVIQYPEGVVGGEPVFIPKGEEDDDGYIGLLLWNEKTQESTFAAYDAKTFSCTPVVEFLVHRRVPLGFHAAWITEQQFQQQLQK